MNDNDAPADNVATMSAHSDDSRHISPGQLLREAAGMVEDGTYPATKVRHRPIPPG